jgi:uncharacterized repeat protein (TIGR01451 family)
MQRLEVRTLLSIGVLQNFPNINFNQASCGCTPPDTMMAVGPTTVLGAVNTALDLTDKSGNTIASPEAFRTFFSSIYHSGDRLSDPYVIYDDQAGVYYVGIIEYPSAGNVGYFDFAVSNSNTPTGLTVGTGAGNWTVFAQISSVDEGGTEFPDFPKMGWNNDAVFVSFNQFLSGSSFSHDLVLAISKSSILGHGSLSMFQTDVSTGSDINILIPARMHNESSGNLEYFAQATGGGAASTTVNVVAETGYLSSSPSFTTTPITVNSYSNSPGVPGLTSQIDDRMLSADWVNNLMVASMNVGVGGLNLARWYEFNTSGTPTLVTGQQGNISPGSGISTSYPSVGIDPGGDIGMTFIQSSSTQPYSMYVTARQASDPSGTMQTPVEIVAGVQPVPSALRGGDYSATEYDPVNTSQFWSANEYNFDNSGNNFHWGTQIANYWFGPGAPLADLAVSETGPSSGNEGDTFTYTMRVTNNNPLYPNDAAGVVLKSTLNSFLKFVSATTTQGTFTVSGQVVTFSLGTVAYGSGSITATVTAQATEDGRLFDKAAVTYAHDPIPGNNNASVITQTAEPAIKVSGPIIVTQMQVTNITVATFTHASGVEPASAFVATINWGDGTTSHGSIYRSGTTYTVTGSHTYSSGGSHTVTTTVVEAGVAPIGLPTGTGPGGGADVPFALLGLSKPAVAPARDSSGAIGAAILDLYGGALLEHGQVPQGSGLRLAVKGKTRMAGIEPPDAAS